MRRCVACGGVYDPDQHGGYYHACPDSVPEKDRRNENIDDSDPPKGGFTSENPAPIKAKGKGWFKAAAPVE